MDQSKTLKTEEETNIILLADIIEKVAWEVWISCNQRLKGDIVELTGDDGRFEGIVILVERERYHTVLDETYEATLEWDRPVGYRKERWLVEWLPVTEFTDLKDKYPSKWFTQAALQGKKGHRTLCSPTRDLDTNLGRTKHPRVTVNDPNRLDRLYEFNGKTIF